MPLWYVFSSWNYKYTLRMPFAVKLFIIANELPHYIEIKMLATSWSIVSYGKIFFVYGLLTAMLMLCYTCCCSSTNGFDFKIFDLSSKISVIFLICSDDVKINVYCTEVKVSKPSNSCC